MTIETLENGDYITYERSADPNGTWRQEIKELYRLGFNFQGHSWTHTNLTKYSQEELYKELFLSKQAIETLTNNVISEICFPQGFYSDLVVEEARKAG